MSLRYFLPLYLPAYVITAFFWRSYAVYKYDNHYQREQQLKQSTDENRGRYRSL